MSGAVGSKSPERLEELCTRQREIETFIPSPYVHQKATAMPTPRSRRNRCCCPPRHCQKSRGRMRHAVSNNDGMTIKAGAVLRGASRRSLSLSHLNLP